MYVYYPTYIYKYVSMIIYLIRQLIYTCLQCTEYISSLQIQYLLY